jgi:hypothetical protein
MRPPFRWAMLAGLALAVITAAFYSRRRRARGALRDPSQLTGWTPADEIRQAASPVMPREPDVGL